MRTILDESYLNRKNLIQGLTLSGTFFTLLTSIIFGFILEGPNTARISFVTMFIAFGLFLLARSKHYKIAIHLFNGFSIVYASLVMIITPQVDVIIILLVPLFLINLFYRPLTILILSFLALIASNIFALTYVADLNPFPIDDLIARDIVAVSLIMYMFIASYLRQISEEKSQASRQELEASEERFRQMVTSSPNFTAIYNVLSRTIKTWNMPGYLGYPVEEIIGSHKWDRVVHEDSSGLMPEIRRILTNKTDINTAYELKVKASDGKEHWINYQISTLQKSATGEVDLRLITLSDITAIKLMERQKLREDLEKQKAEMIDTIVSGFSHEFRTPLATIETNLFMLENHNQNEKSTQYINKARSQIKRIVNLTEQLNTLIRLRNESDLTLSRVNINELLESCIKRNEHRISAKTLTLNTDYSPDNIYSLIDIKLMNILLDNLLDNAIKFTDEDGSIAIKTEREFTSAKIIIEDSGIGISEKMLNDIYDLFSREDNSHSRVGLGIGLSIVKAIADSHNHELRITSKADCCTTVELSIPIIPQIPA